MTLAKGQEDLKALLEKEKEKEKKKNKRAGVATLGRIFENQARRVLDFPSTSDEGVGKGKGTAVESESEEEEDEENEDYSKQ